VWFNAWDVITRAYPDFADPLFFSVVAEASLQAATELAIYESLSQHLIKLHNLLQSRTHARPDFDAYLAYVLMTRSQLNQLVVERLSLF